MMKVLFVSCNAEKGGAVLSLLGLVVYLKKKYGIEPIVLTPGYTEINECYNKLGIENHAIRYIPFMQTSLENPLKQLCKYTIRLVEYRVCNQFALHRVVTKIDFGKISIIHTNNSRVDFGAILAKKYNIPHVWHLREFGEKDFNCYSYIGQYTAYMNSCDSKFIAVSKAVKDEWVRKGLDEKSITVIYNGIGQWEKIEYVESQVEREGITRIIFSALLSPAKGLDQLIKAVALLPEKERGCVRIDIYGFGKDGYLNPIKKLIDKLGLGEQICFMGYCNHIFDFLCKYDIGVVCSRSEGFGRVTAEYMFAGLAVIASDTGANPELITDGVNGFLYSYGDINDLSNKLKMLIKNNILLMQVGKSARDYAVTYFTGERNAECIWDFYKMVKLDSLGNTEG